MLATRLRELCEARRREDAVTLAKASLRSGGTVDVSVDGSRVLVEAGLFRGVHRWDVTSSGAVAVEQRGRYTCVSDGIDLAFSTATMNESAYERALSAIEAERGREDDGAEDEWSGRSGTEALESERNSAVGWGTLVDRLLGAIP